MAENDDEMIEERTLMLQKYLRKISSIISVNYTHPTTPKIHLALQSFVGIDEKLLNKFYVIDRMLRRRRRFHVIRMIETLIQSIMCLHIMDRVVASFCDQFKAEIADSAEDEGADEATRIAAGVSRLAALRAFIDNLQSILFESLYEDCRLVALRYEFKPECVKHLRESAAPNGR